MVKKRVDCRARIFAVAGAVKEGDEVALHDVLTWPKLSDAEAWCASGESGISQRVVVAESGASFEGGMTMTIGERGAWVLKRGDDRSVWPLKEGQVLSVLESDWQEIKGTRMWEVRAKVVGHIESGPEGTRYVPRGLGS